MDDFPNWMNSRRADKSLENIFIVSAFDLNFCSICLLTSSTTVDSVSYVDIRYLFVFAWSSVLAFCISVIYSNTFSSLPELKSTFSASNETVDYSEISFVVEALIGVPGFSYPSSTAAASGSASAPDKFAQSS